MANGSYCGGTLIYGYKLENELIPGKANKFYKKVVINEEEAELVRLPFNYYNKGYTKKQIADMLNKQGYRIKGKLLKGKSFDKWLTNQKYTGTFTFGGRECSNMYLLIIEKETFDAVQERLTKNRYTLAAKKLQECLICLRGNYSATIAEPKW